MFPVWQLVPLRVTQANPRGGVAGEAGSVPAGEKVGLWPMNRKEFVNRFV